MRRILHAASSRSRLGKSIIYGRVQYKMPHASLVLMGNDLRHPASTSREVAALAPNSTFIEHWKEPEHQPAAKKAVEEFLAKNTPR